MRFDGPQPIDTICAIFVTCAREDDGRRICTPVVRQAVQKEVDGHVTLFTHPRYDTEQAIDQGKLVAQRRHIDNIRLGNHAILNKRHRQARRLLQKGD